MYTSKYRTQIKYLGIIVLLTIIFLVAKAMEPNVAELKMMQVTEATKQVKLLTEEQQEITNKLVSVINRLNVYKKCIVLNNKYKESVVYCDQLLINASKNKIILLRNRNGFKQDIPQLNTTGVYNRIEELLSYYPKVNGMNIEILKEFDKTYKLKPGVAICIAKADSSLGNELKTTHNYGNVNNNDRGHTQSYANRLEGIQAIYKVLNNKYLGGNRTLGDLSGKYKDCSKSKGNTKCYATSLSNHYNNTVNCLRTIYQDNTIGKDWNFITN